MTEPTTPKPVGQSRSSGTWLCCPACGRMLKIEWRTRSIVCSCGKRVPRSQSEQRPVTPAT